MNTKKNEDIQAKKAEWKEKGIDWCITKLWSTREDAKKTRKELAELFGIKNYLYDVRRENEALKNVLEENGIRATKLRVYYKDKGYTRMCLLREDVADCPNCFEENCEGNEKIDYCHDCIETISWYSYKIDNGKIEGIVSNFCKDEYECYKIIDERTGEVLYEEKEKNDD